MGRQNTQKTHLLSEILNSAPPARTKPALLGPSIVARAALSVVFALLSSSLFTAGAQVEEGFWLRRPDIRVENTPELATAEGRALLFDAVKILYSVCPGLSALTQDGARMVISAQFAIGNMPLHAAFGWDYDLFIQMDVLGGLRGTITYALGDGRRPGIALMGLYSSRYCTAEPESGDLRFIPVAALSRLKALDRIERKSP